MIVKLYTEDVTTWFVAFMREGIPWIDRVFPGRFKHVRAFAFSHGAQCWVFYDHTWSGTHITLAPAGSIGDATMGKFVEDAVVLKLSRTDREKGRLSRKLGFWCVPAVRALLRVPGGALRPDGFYRECLRAGAEVVVDGTGSTDTSAGPDARRADRAGAAS